ncbi:RNA polymerase sigma factor [Conexibacter sp. S30A1]|uniref:RNA polymerase sigma factor n=1 Tax=Conexibacter sp. S30A1 TaxID=2937800 RepID=UPI00200C8121|nr:sigma-70 family RNA polymerase sigma factor [Conexibacter sp. S30A1]
MPRFKPRNRRPIAGPGGADDDAQLLERLRSGDEAAFSALVERHHDPMLRLARTFVQSQAVAEEIVQDTWVAVLHGIENFEGRSSLRTWLLAILVNRARSTGAREARTVPSADPTPAVDAARFNAGGGWSTPPEQWAEDVEARLSADTLAPVIREELERMPARQRAVVMLRDVDQLRSDEVCQVLGLSAVNERVLLHRGRGRLRQALEDAIGGC